MDSYRNCKIERGFFLFKRYGKFSLCSLEGFEERIEVMKYQSLQIAKPVQKIHSKTKIGSNGSQ